MIPGKVAASIGGSAANTVFALTGLNVPSALVGKLGNDEEGRYYRRIFEQIGGDCSRLKTCDLNVTARCLSLVTPDSERTMRTDLGAAVSFAPEEVSVEDFKNCERVHVEGCLLCNRDLFLDVLNAAKQAGCMVSLDLGSFALVSNTVDILPELLDNYVDVVLANENEAAVFCGKDDP